MFKKGDIVVHKSGNEYEILFTPDISFYEPTMAQVYVYTDTKNVWVRPKSVFEDGRFTKKD